MPKSHSIYNSKINTAARLGVADLREGLMNWRIWHLMGTGELRRRYARSRIGQFWLSLSTGLSTLILGVVWSVLWNVQPGTLLPHLTVSILIWQFMSAVVSEAADVFTSNRHLLLSQRLACSTLVISMVYKNLIVLAHNAVIIVAVFLIFQQPITSQIFLLVPAMILLAFTSVWLGCLLGMVCARFRDVSHALQSVLQLGFYVTPVIWKPEFLTEHYRWLLMFNPFASFITIVRSAVIGGPVPTFEWQLASVIAIGGFVMALPLIGTYRRRLIFWI
jgi:ABC-type polysaccharide/polyol phosphate export permease